MDKHPYSQLRAMLAITKASLTNIRSNPASILFSIVFPLIFVVVFGFLSGSEFKIDVGVEKNCDTTNVIYQAIATQSTIRLVTDQSERDMGINLTKGKLDGVLLIQKSAVVGEPYIVNLKTTKASLQGGAFLKFILNEIIDKQTLKTNPTPSIAVLKETEQEGRAYRNIDFILPGQLGFSLLSVGVFGTAFVFMGLRQTLVIKRFFATPIQKPYIILGEALSRMTFGMIAAIIIIGVGHFTFGFTLIEGWVTVLKLLVLSALGLLVFMGFGFVVSGIAKDESAVPPLSNIVTLPQFLLAGTFFSISAFPSWLQPISKALPLTYLNEAMRKIAFEGAGFGDVLPNIFILIGWGVVIYAVAVKTFRWQ